MKNLVKLFGKVMYCSTLLLSLLLIAAGCGSAVAAAPESMEFFQHNSLRANAIYNATDPPVSYSPFLNSKEIEGYEADNIVYMELENVIALHFNNVRFVPEFAEINMGSVLINRETNVLTLSLELKSSKSVYREPQRLLTYSVDRNTGELLGKEINPPAIPQYHSELLNLTDRRLIAIADEFAAILEEAKAAIEKRDPYQVVRDELSQEFGIKIRIATEEELTRAGLHQSGYSLPPIEKYRETLRKEIIANNIANQQAEAAVMTTKITGVGIVPSLLNPSVGLTTYAQRSDNCVLHVKGTVLYSNDEYAGTPHWCWVDDAYASPWGGVPWFFSDDYSCEFVDYGTCVISYSGFLMTSTGDVIEGAQRTAAFIIE